MSGGGPHDVQATDIIAQLNKGANIDIDSCVVWGDLDFTLLDGISRIAPSMRQARVDAYITFTDCVFIGKVTAFGKTLTGGTVFSRNLSFVRCDFRDEVDFTESVIEGNVFLTGSTFRKKASWQGAGFRHRKVYFNETKFESEALFQNAVFAGDVNFMNSVFDSVASFQKARTAGTMMFGNVRFDGYADFSHAKTGKSIFNYAVFNHRKDFGDAEGFDYNL
jgi:uncharacterized protein YjbI with pentapeptide repeats